MPTTTQAISLGLLVLFVAFLFPALISSPADGVSINDVRLNDGDNGTEDVGDALHIVLENKTSNSSEVNITSLVSGNETALTVSEGNSANIQIDNQTVTVRNIYVEEGTSGIVDLEVRHPSTFAWDDDSTRLSEHLPTAIAGLALFIVVAFVGAVLK